MTALYGCCSRPASVQTDQCTQVLVIFIAWSLGNGARRCSWLAVRKLSMSACVCVCSAAHETARQLNRGSLSTRGRIMQLLWIGVCRRDGYYTSYCELRLGSFSYKSIALHQLFDRHLLGLVQEEQSVRLIQLQDLKCWYCTLVTQSFTYKFSSSVNWLANQ